MQSTVILTLVATAVAAREEDAGPAPALIAAFARVPDPRHHALTLRGQPRLQDATRAAIQHPASVAPIKEEGHRACYHGM